MANSLFVLHATPYAKAVLHATDGGGIKRRFGWRSLTTYFETFRQRIYFDNQRVENPYSHSIVN
jgi:hypothetical protein